MYGLLVMLISLCTLLPPTVLAGDGGGVTHVIYPVNADDGSGAGVNMGVFGGAYAMMYPMVMQMPQMPQMQVVTPMQGVKFDDASSMGAIMYMASS